MVHAHGTKRRPASSFCCGVPWGGGARPRRRDVGDPGRQRTGPLVAPRQLRREAGPAEPLLQGRPGYDPVPSPTAGQERRHGQHRCRQRDPRHYPDLGRRAAGRRVDQRAPGRDLSQDRGPARDPARGAGRTVWLDIRISQQLSEARPDGRPRASRGSPTILNRQISTSLTLKDGGSLLMGGLISGNRSAGEVRGVPLLGRMPVLGRLFRADAVQQDPHGADDHGHPLRDCRPRRGWELTRQIRSQLDLHEELAR